MDLIEVIGDGHYATPVTPEEKFRDDVGFTNPNLHRRIDYTDLAIEDYFITNESNEVLLVEDDVGLIASVESEDTPAIDENVIMVASGVGQAFLLDSDNVILADDDTGILVNIYCNYKTKENEYLLNIYGVNSYRTTRTFTYCSDEDAEYYRNYYEIP